MEMHAYVEVLWYICKCRGSAGWRRDWPYPASSRQSKCGHTRAAAGYDDVLSGTVYDIRVAFRADRCGVRCAGNRRGRVDGDRPSHWLRIALERPYQCAGRPLGDARWRRAGRCKSRCRLCYGVTVVLHWFHGCARFI